MVNRSLSLLGGIWEWQKNPSRDRFPVSFNGDGFFIRIWRSGVGQASAVAESNGFTNTDVGVASQCESYSESYSDSNADSHTYTDSYANADSNSHANPNPDTNAGANANADTKSDAPRCHASVPSRSLIRR